MSSNERILNCLLMKARSKLWDCHGIFKLFVSDNWLVKDRGQGQDYLHFWRQPELGDDGLLLTLEILNHNQDETVNKASWLKWSLPIVRQSDCWLSDRKTSQGCELWIVWMFESRGAMSAIFPGDLCVQTSVLAGDGYLVIVHVITDVAIAPGISHHSSVASIVTQMTWTTWAMLTQSWQIMSFVFGKKTFSMIFSVAVNLN